MAGNYRDEIRKRTIRSAPQIGKHHGEGPSDGAQRNARIAAKVADRKADSAANKEQKIADRTAAAEKRRKETLAMAKEDIEEAKKPGGSLLGDRRVQNALMVAKVLQGKGSLAPAPKKEVAKEETGTEARTKIKNVARPDDADPTSEKSTLAKTGEIKVKKVDEQIADSISRKYGLTDSLVGAVRAILEKKEVDGKATEVDTKPETNDKVNDGDDSSDAKKGKKKLDPVGKEDDDVDNDGDVDDSDKYLKNRRKAIGKAMKEDVEQIDELKKSTLASYVNKASDDATKHSYIAGKTGDVDKASKASQRIRGIATATKKLAKEDVEQVDELNKSTLASYTKKAVSDVATRTHDLAKAPGMLTKDAEYMDRYQKFRDKTEKRKGMISKAVDRLAKEEVVTESPADEPVNEATHIFHVHLKGAEPRSRRVTDPHSFAGDRRVDDEPAGKEERGSKIILRVKAPTRTKALGAAAKHAAKNYGVDNVRSIVHKGIAEEVEQVDEVLSKKASAGEWIKDFQSSDNPKFAGKSPEKRKQMALAAYYAKQRNEEVEEVEEAIKPYVSFSGPRQGKVPSATVMGPNEKPHKVFTKAEHGHDYKEKALDYFKKHGKKLSEDVEQIDEARSKEGYQTWPGQKKKSFFTNKAMGDETRKWKERKDAERAEREKASLKKEEVEQHRKTHPLPKEFSAEEIARLEEIAKQFD